MTDLQVKNDLEDYAVDPRFEERYMSRYDMMEAMLPEGTKQNSYTNGGYHGTIGFVIELDDYIWIIKESYGSCSYCDGFIDSDKEAYTRKMMRNAYCLENISDAIEFMGTQNGYGWDKIRHGVVDILKAWKRE